MQCRQEGGQLCGEEAYSSANCKERLRSREESRQRKQHCPSEVLSRGEPQPKVLVIRSRSYCRRGLADPRRRIVKTSRETIQSSLLSLLRQAISLNQGRIPKAKAQPTTANDAQRGTNQPIFSFKNLLITPSTKTW